MTILPLPRLIVILLAVSGSMLALTGAEFRALSWEGSISDVTFAGQPRGTKLQVSDVALTNWQKITPTAAGIEFRQALTAGAANASLPTPQETVLARVIWPEGIARALVLLVPTNAGAPTPYNAVVIPERAADATPPAWRLFNYSSAPVAVELGTAGPQPVAPGAYIESELRTPGGAPLLKLAYAIGTHWEVIANQKIVMPPGFATYLFVRNVPRSEQQPGDPTVTYKLIYDRLPAPPVTLTAK